MLNTDYKNNNVRNFQFTKFSFIDSVLTDRRSLSGKRPKSASGKSSSCRFSFSAANVNTKATEYVSCGFSFCILVLFPLLEKFEPHYLSSIQIFLSVLAAIIRESSDKLLCAENREGFAVYSSTSLSGAKGE